MFDPFPLPWLRRLLVTALLSLPLLAHGQQDSTAIYKKIERISRKHALTRLLYGSVFVPTTADEAPPPTRSGKRRSDPNARYKGRIVRQVIVRVFDPFGYSVDDTTEHHITWSQRTGNALHRSTRPHIIRNLLLVHPADTLDPLSLSESERVLRASPIVNDARVYAQPVKGQRDSVDVVVLVLDKWSIGAEGAADLGSVDLSLTERDLLGLGQELQQGFSHDLGSSRVDLFGHHSIYNIGRSYVSSRLYYATSAPLDQVGFSLDRPFYSPLAQWAGGFALARNWGRVPTTLPNGEPFTTRVDPVTLDTWLAHAFPLGSDRSDAGRSSKLVLGMRYAQTRYAERPDASLDTLRANSNTAVHLVSAGLSLRQYYKERYLFRFGTNEDVPEGLYVGVSAGARKRELTDPEGYIGAEIARGGNTDRFGYVALDLAYGTYVLHGRSTEATLRAEITYFTDLLPLGRWNVRQFVRSHTTIGYDKPAYTHLQLGGDELFGLSDDALVGTSKTVLALETVAYAPYNLWGFRIAPVLRVAFGCVGDDHAPLVNGPVYSAFGLGLLVRNERLLVKTFDLSIGLFPYLPSGGANVVLDPFNSVDPRLRDYAFTRPGEVAFE